MDKDLEEFKRFVESQTNSDGGVPAFVGEWAESFITKDNVEAVIEYLTTLPGNANLVFWERINKAPNKEEDWDKVVYLGAEMSNFEETQKKLREKGKKVVKLVRSTKYYQNYLNELFRNNSA